MGFFSNKDKPCPVCGGATPRLMATKIQGEAICSKCADNIMAEDEMVESWSIADLKEHLRYRQENQKLLDGFTATRSIDYDREMVIDDANRLFYINQFTDENPPVFHFADIVGFEMRLDYGVVESWSRGMARTPYRPPALGLASGLSMLAEAFGANSKEKKENKFQELKVMLRVNTPYLKEYELCDLSISGEGAAEFEHSFAEELAKADTVCNLIVSLAGGTTTAVESPAAAAGPAPSAPAAAPSTTQITEDIKKFKALLDEGIITQAEFDAKRKQLLGL